MATATMESGRQAEAADSGLMNWISQIAFLCAIRIIRPCMTRLPIWIMRLSGATGFWKMRDDGKITQMAYAAAVVENITLKRPGRWKK